MLPLLAGLLALPCGANSADELLPARKDALVHLLRHDCGSCHGLHLSGGLGPPLTAAVLSGKSAAALEMIIAHGVPGTPMPPWRALLDDAEIRWLVAAMQDGLVVDTTDDNAWRRE